MSSIRINIDEVRKTNLTLRKTISNVTSVKSDISSLRFQVSGRVQARRNIGERINSTYQSLCDLEFKLIDLETFVNNAMNRYSDAENAVRKKAISLSTIENNRLSSNMDAFKGRSGKQNGVEPKFQLELLDEILGFPITSGAVNGIDRYIKIEVESVVGEKKEMISFNELSESLKGLEYNHAFRRNMLRDVPKECRDIELKLPQNIKIAKGFGVVSTAFLATTYAEDFKNNNTSLNKMEAVGVDTSVTLGSYFLTDAAVDLTVGAAVVICTAAALPEIAVGMVVVGTAVATATAVGIGASFASSWLKNKLKLR